ncbi:hypothetical protein [Rhodococcoides kyotonense]|uniref:Uncharacterized protein n=1 Tax=Rhodococcoides kyotonense TaxID=398843 RepID=A0A177YKF4_9NOCA|nr:hypothetical protein [Rhodococcus kyotonensis]OAK55983.1 hypothetical protein A3K89_18860 [Rhodococcus kyotonensis]
MYVYENLVRDHELRVAKSLERYELRKHGRSRTSSDGLALFAAARRLVASTGRPDSASMVRGSG